MTTEVLIDLMPSAGVQGLRGIGRYVRGLARAIEADEALRLMVVGLVGSDRGTDRTMAVVRAPIPQRAIEWRWQDLAWLSGWVSDSATALKVRPRVFHHTDPRKPFRPALIARLAVSAYDLTPLEPVIWKVLRRHRRALYRKYLHLMASAERVLAISHTTADRVAEQLDIDRRRIDVVYPVVQRTPSARAPSSGEPVFLLVGAPDPHKSPELAIAALAAFRKLGVGGRLRVIGPVARLHRQQIAAAARAHGVSDHVVVEGWVSETALEAAYSTAHAVISVSANEGFGLPPVEAALRGVPVVSVDSPVARETLARAASFAPADAGSLAIALESAAPPTPEDRDSLAARYAPERAAAALRSAYSMLLESA